MQLIVACMKAASFVNFCIFLTRGHYAFIVERFLGTRVVYPSRHLLRQVSYLHCVSKTNTFSKTPVSVILKFLI